MTTRRARHAAECATDREVGVVAAVLAAGSEKAAAHRLGLSHSTVKHHLANARSKVGAATTAQLVWILASRLPEPESEASSPLETTSRCQTVSRRLLAVAKHPRVDPPDVASRLRQAGPWRE
jgi:DNA-binding CsgD family transcriptional regulator